jgi:DNA invertase Pin-like site-specific DNA recombinase
MRVIEDRALSGAFAGTRPGFQQLLVAGRRREFDVLVCESPSRLGRRLADLAGLQDEMRFGRIRILTVQYGMMTDMHIGVLGTMAQMQLTELRAHTIRGQWGSVREGRVAGGIAYGYEAVPGEGNAGLRCIHEEQATIVRRVFRLFAAGWSAGAIARCLNAEGVPGPRGGAWNHTTICGH